MFPFTYININDILKVFSNVHFFYLKNNFSKKKVII
nr:MAG TPA: hypothetical protein [Caudoviricetes sp.]